MHLLRRRRATPSFVKAASAASATAPSLGTFGVDFLNDDFVICIATRHLDNTIPDLPAGRIGADSFGTTLTRAGVGSYAVRVGASFISGGAFTPGVWTNAQHTLLLVYRNVDPETAIYKGILTDQAAAANGTVVPYSALSWTPDTNLVPAFAVAVYAEKLDNGASVGVLPAGVTERHVRASGVAETRAGDSLTLAQSFSALSGSQAAATTNGLITATLALRGAKI